MITIFLNQEVGSATGYITCVSGIFDPFDFVLCKRKEDTIDSTCAFLAFSVLNITINNEETI